jgi:hypothetical protein
VRRRRGQTLLAASAFACLQLARPNAKNSFVYLSIAGFVVVFFFFFFFFFSYGAGQ